MWVDSYLAHGFLVSQHDFLVLLINSFWKSWSRRIHCMFQIPKTHFPCWDIHVWRLHVKFHCLAAWFPYLAHGFLVSQHDFFVLLINSFWKPWSRRIHCMFQIPKTHFPCWDIHVWRLHVRFSCLTAWFPYLAHGFLVSQHDFLVLLINSFWKPWSRRIHCMFQIQKTHFPCWDIHIWRLHVTLPVILDFFFSPKVPGGGKGRTCLHLHK